MPIKKSPAPTIKAQPIAVQPENLLSQTEEQIPLLEKGTKNYYNCIKEKIVTLDPVQRKWLVLGSVTAVALLLSLGIVFGSARISEEHAQYLNEPLTPPITPPITPGLTPSPTPTINTPLVITTTSLPSGLVGKNYSASVVGSTQNPNSNLVMSITNLPNGLSQGSCSLVKNRRDSKITCSIKGKPRLPGAFQVTVKLQGNSGIIVQKNLPLIIK